MNISKTERLAWRAVISGFAQASKISPKAGSIYAGSFRESLRIVDIYSKEEKINFYEAVIEGVPQEVSDPGAVFGPIAFETFVQISLAWRQFTVDKNMLTSLRARGAEAEPSFLEMFSLSKAITSECRRRYAPHLPPPSEPPEPIETSSLSLERIGEISLRIFKFHLKAEAERHNYTATFGEIKKLVELSPAILRVSKIAFLRDLQEGLNLSRPRHGQQSVGWLAFERNRAVALAAAMTDIRHDDIGFEDVIRERVEELAKAAKISLAEAAGYLLYLVSEKIDRGCDP